MLEHVFEGMAGASRRRTDKLGLQCQKLDWANSISRRMSITRSCHTMQTSIQTYTSGQISTV